MEILDRTILYFQPDVNEADERWISTKRPDATWKGENPGLRFDPAMWSNVNFGRLLQNDLENIGRGYTCEVTDFKKYVVVRVAHHDYVTGKAIAKDFLIVFDRKDRGNGIIMSNSARWRSISGVSQASSYIRSAVTELANQTSSRSS